MVNAAIMVFNCLIIAENLFGRRNRKGLTFAAASEAAPPCLNRDHGACASI